MKMPATQSKAPKHIVYQGKEIARVVYSHRVSGLEFFTENESFLQVAIHDKDAGVEIVPHSHRCEPFAVNRMEEVFYIVKGKVLVTLYDQNSGEVIQRVIIRKGDMMFHFAHGHGLSFLKPTILFEVKQGPFLGTKNSKVYFRDRSTNSS